MMKLVEKYITPIKQGTANNISSPREPVNEAWLRIILKQGVITPSKKEVTELKKRLHLLYKSRKWTVPGEEIEETFARADLILTLEFPGKLAGFFAARSCHLPGAESFYYLERLIMAPWAGIGMLVPLAAKLVFNLPGFGEKEIILCAITRLKVIRTMMNALGDKFYCSTEKSDKRKKANQLLKALSSQLRINSRGILKEVFHPGFTHDKDPRVIKEIEKFKENDALFLMNTISGSSEEIYARLSRCRYINTTAYFPRMAEFLLGKKNILPGRAA